MNFVKSKDSTPRQDKTMCNNISDESVTINATTGKQVTMRCSTVTPVLYELHICYWKQLLIRLEYIIDSTKENDEYAEEFEQSVKTLRIFFRSNMYNKFIEEISINSFVNIIT